MNYVSVSSLEKYQHYKDRHMVWFKFYLDILQNFQFMELTERERWVFIGVICLACKNDNKVPLDDKYLDRTLNTKDSIKSIDTLTSIGLLSSCYQDAIPIREEKKREEKIDISKTKFLDFVYLTPQQHESLVAKLGGAGADRWIGKVNTYAHKIGERKFNSKYKSHYHVILEWSEKEGKPVNAQPEQTEEENKAKQASLDAKVAELERQNALKGK